MAAAFAKAIDMLLARRGLGGSLIGLALAAALLTFKPGEVAELGETWFDAMNQIWPRPRKSEPVVIVAIDEASISAIGVWPWPREKTAELFERIALAGPAAVGVDIIFSEAQPGAPAELAARPDAPPAARAWLKNLPSGDDALADAMAIGPFVLGVGDTSEPAEGPPDGMYGVVIVDGPDPGDALLDWRAPFQPLRSRQSFVEASSGEGVIALNEGFDGVARRTGQLFDLGGKFLAPGLAVEMLRVAAGANRIVAKTNRGGVESLVLMAGKEPLLAVPTEPDGALRPWFGPRDRAREVPAIALLEDDAELARLEGKLVLVGYTAAGGLDDRVTPLEEVTPGIDVHRQTLEGVFDQALVTRPAWAGRVELVLALALAAVASFGPLRLQVATGVAVGVGMIATPLAASLALYIVAQWAFDGATLALTTLLAGAPAFAVHLGLAERERRWSEAVRARVDGEMAAAKRIQMGILPKAAETFPDEARFSIAAVSEPARTVGGDLYDFFLLDDGRLFFLVGDVAGKGPEASLFMAISKSLLKSAALRGGDDLGAMLTEANAEIARDNPATMFVTAFAGILDIETGVLDFCCAGHEPPWRISSGDASERLEGVGGPPLCLLDDFPYPTDRIELNPGDMIVVVTDGVTEAANQNGELFGVERTQDAIDRIVDAADAGAALDGLIAPVAVFADGEEAADDLTALVVIWPGPNGFDGGNVKV